MELTINLDLSSASIEIIKNGQKLDDISFSYYHDLDDKLITFIDKIVKKNKIDISDIRSYKIQGITDKNSTSVRITESVVAGLKA